MRIRLDYGRTGLEVELPARNVDAVLEMGVAVPIADPLEAIRRALADPIGSSSLATIARERRNACILICDITRPVPNEPILTAILETLERAGIARPGILILVATGLHRASTPAERIEMVGERIARDYRIEDHDGKNVDAHEFLGTTPNQVPAYIDRRYIQADLKITTGLIEPHLMAGYSGGRKVICPGIAALPTVRAWHSPRFLEHPRATTGIIEQNPVHEENTRIARMAGCDFIVNVCLDGHRRITHVVAGDMEQAWEEGVAFCRRQASAHVPKPFDIVVTSSAGYPLDTTFYQSVKGMIGALPVVRQGGTIVMAASLTEGVGSPEFTQLLESTDSIDGFLEAIENPDFFVMDQWQLEELARVVKHCGVTVVSDGLPADQLDRYFVKSAPSVEKAVEKALAEHGDDARIAVIPKGPYVLPSVA